MLQVETRIERFSTSVVDVIKLDACYFMARVYKYGLLACLFQLKRKHSLDSYKEFPFSGILSTV